MFEELVLRGLRHFAPEIKAKGAPMIKQLICQILDEYKPRLQPNEESVDIIIQVHEGEPMFMICSMSSDNCVLRCFGALTVQDLINKAELLGKKYQIL